MLSDAQGESMTRIAHHCSNTHRGVTLTRDERYEAALTGIAEYLADNSWPDPVKPLFLAGTAAINQEARERIKHIRHWSYWYEPPGVHDSMAEQISDRVGVHQLCYALSDTQWAAIWALAEVMRRGGGIPEAAALLGIPDYTVTNRLTAARRVARRLWIAPGETPASHFWQPNGGRLDRWRWNRADTQRKREQRKTAA
jgi:hypothetical protein